MKKALKILIPFLLILLTYSYCSTNHVMYPGDSWAHLSGGNIGDTICNGVDFHLSWPFIKTKTESAALALFAHGNRLVLFVLGDFSIGVYECIDSDLWGPPDYSSDYVNADSLNQSLRHSDTNPNDSL